MLTLFVSRPLPDRVIARACDMFDVTVRSSTLPLTLKERIASLAEYDLVLPTLGDFYTADVFAKVSNPRCKLLANFGVGYNHIDVAAAKAAGIAVTNTPGAVTDATADIALMLMLMTCRRAGEGERLLRSGKWEGWHPTQLLGMHMSGKTLGIVGMGRIGQAIAQRAHSGFGMSVKYVNRSAKHMAFPAEPVATLTGLAAGVDILVVAVPGAPDTRHLIGRDVFKAMQPQGVIVNIARGEVVDEAALIAALQSGEIAGAGLDVYEFEPEVPEAFMQMENVTLLPHLGTAALEVRESMGMMAVDNLTAFAENRPLINQV